MARTEKLEAGSILTITADAVTSGRIFRVGVPGAGVQYPSVEIAASEVLAFGPFTEARTYEINSDQGALAVVVSQPNEPGPTVETQSVFFGLPSTFAAGRDFELYADNQATIFGTITCAGNLTVAGDLRITT